MKHLSNQSLAATLVAAGICMACAANAGDTQGRDTSAGSSSGAGMRVYIDPATGKPAVPPPGTEVVPTDKAARAVPDLPDEVPNPGPAGGYMLDTRGMRSEFRQTTGADGKPVIECHPKAVAPATENER